VDEWAAMTLPKVQAHLDQAKTLESQVKQHSNGNGNGQGQGTQGSQQ